MTIKYLAAGKVAQLAADEGYWLTTYQEGWDIALFTAAKRLTMPSTNVPRFREISDAEYQHYMDILATYPSEM